MKRIEKAQRMVQKVLDDVRVEQRITEIAVDESDVDPENADNDLCVTGILEIIASYDEPELDYFAGTGYEGGWCVSSASFTGEMRITDPDGKILHEENLIFLNLE
jgi:hypothetical protein